LHATPTPIRRRSLWLAGIGLAIAAAAFALLRAGVHASRYLTAPVTRGTVQRSISTTGALNPVVTVNVGSYVSGTIKQLSCDYNTEVTVGQQCALVDPVPFQLVVDQDRAEVVTAQAQVKKDLAALKYAKQAWERDAKLVEEGTVSQDTVDSEKSAYDQATAQISFDDATVAQRQAALKAAEVNLAYTAIVSPVVGTVITRSIDVGQTVAASLQTPTLFIIAKDLTKMQVDTNVSEADVGGIRMGQDTNFSVQAFPGRVFHGAVTQIRRGPITVQNVVTYDVVIAFDNPDRVLFPGMTADVHIVTAEHRDVLRVPLPATRFSPEGLGHERKAPGRTPGPARAAESESASGAAPGGQGAPSGDVATAPGGEAANGEREHRRFQGGGRRDHGDGATSTTPGPEGGEAPRRWAAGGDRSHREPGGEGGRGSHRGGAQHAGQVWVLAEPGGKPKPVDVVLGLDDGAFIEVSGPGLKEGDVVVVNQVGDEAKDRRAPTPPAGALRQGGPRL
jgi:HlyD family secretion protein